MGFLYWWERSDNQDDEFDDEYYEGLWGIRLTAPCKAFLAPDQGCDLDCVNCTVTVMEDISS